MGKNITDTGYEYYQKITEDGIVTETNTEPTEKHYSFSGSIFRFGKYVSDFRADTFAKSEAQARNNLTYQAKKQLRLMPNAGGIKLVGKLTKVD